MALPGRLLDGIERLDPLPYTIQNLMSVLDKENTNFNQIVDILEYDQAVASNILRVANSAVYAGRFQIEHLRDAVIRLGINNLLNIVLGGHMGMLKVAAPLYGLTENDLWLHATAASLAVKAIIQESHNPQIPQSATIAALVHDVGKLIMVRYMKADVGAVQSHSLQRGIPFVEAERELFNCDHTEVGGAMARKWDFPEPIVQAIEQHHQVPLVNPSPILDAVMLANLTAKSIGVGLGAEGMNLRVDDESRGRIGLSLEGFERVCAQTAVWLTEVKGAYEVKETELS